MCKQEARKHIIIKEHDKICAQAKQEKQKQAGMCAILMANYLYLGKV